MLLDAEVQRIISRSGIEAVEPAVRRSVAVVVEKPSVITQNRPLMVT
jgi:hypothetical protein